MKITRREQAHRASIARLVPAAAAVAIGVVSFLPATGAGAASPVTVSSQTVGKLGKVLVVKGKAAYTVSPAGPCTGLCAKTWPAITVPATVSTVTAGSGVKQSKLGVTAGPNGTHQITYGGQPIYWFSMDPKGKVKVTGNVTDQWGKWAAIVVSKPSHASSGSGSNSGGGSSAGGGGVNF
jgi:predicted lipoprotein with Yx(FWY)xxD motif